MHFSFVFIIVLHLCLPHKFLKIDVVHFIVIPLKNVEKLLQDPKIRSRFFSNDYRNILSVICTDDCLLIMGERAVKNLCDVLQNFGFTQHFKLATITHSGLEQIFTDF